MSTIMPLKLKCTCLDEARWTASIKDDAVLNVAGIHHWRQLEQRRSRQQKEAAQILRALIDQGNREEFVAHEMMTIARKNGAGDAPELKTAGSEPLRKSRNGHG